MEKKYSHLQNVIKFAGIMIVMLAFFVLFPGKKVYAQDYELWISDEQVTDANKNDVMGDGTVSFDPSSNTLTLNNANIKTANFNNPFDYSENYERYIGRGIYSKLSSLNIKGSATITDACIIVSSEGTLYIKGEGTGICINDSRLGILRWGSSKHGTGKTILEGKITISGGIESFGAVEINKGAEINVGGIKSSLLCKSANGIDKPELFMTP